MVVAAAVVSVSETAPVTQSDMPVAKARPTWNVVANPLPMPDAEAAAGIGEPKTRFVVELQPLKPVPAS